MNDPLYRKELLRLAADADGAGRLTRPDATATVHNPVCGDRVTVDLVLEKGRIGQLAHETHACVLTQASAALLASTALGRDIGALTELAAAVEAMLKGGEPVPGYAGIFDGAATHTGRQVCVLLPLQAALKALESLEAPEPGA